MHTNANESAWQRRLINFITSLPTTLRKVTQMTFCEILSFTLHVSLQSSERHLRVVQIWFQMPDLRETMGPRHIVEHILKHLMQI